MDENEQATPPTNDIAAQLASADAAATAAQAAMGTQLPEAEKSASADQPSSAVGDDSTGPGNPDAPKVEDQANPPLVETKPALEVSPAEPTAAQGVMAEIESKLHQLELLPSVTAQWFRDKLVELKSHL